MLRLTAHAADPRGLQGSTAQQALVARAQQYMIRRTSETLKQYLPAKVQEVRTRLISALCCVHEFGCTRHAALHAFSHRCKEGPWHATSALAASALPSTRQCRSTATPLCNAPHSAVPLHRSPTCVTCQVIFCKMSALQHSIYKGFLASEAVTGAGRAAG